MVFGFFLDWNKVPGAGARTPRTAGRGRHHLLMLAAVSQLLARAGLLSSATDRNSAHQWCIDAAASYGLESSKSRCQGGRGIRPRARWRLRLQPPKRMHLGGLGLAGRVAPR